MSPLSGLSYIVRTLRIFVDACFHSKMQTPNVHIKGSLTFETKEVEWLQRFADMQ